MFQSAPPRHIENDDTSLVEAVRGPLTSYDNLEDNIEIIGEVRSHSTTSA